MAKKKSTSSLLRKIKKSLLKKPRSQKEKENYLKSQALKMDKSPTKPESLFLQILKELNIEYKTQEIVGGKIFDFFIPLKNTLIEIDGDYWHGYGLLQEEMSNMQKNTAKNDKLKDSIARSNGFEIIRIWEHELMKDYEKTKEKFNYLISN